MYRYFILVLLLAGCSFGPASSSDERNSFACESTQAMCIATKQTCVTSDNKKSCTTTLDVTCNPRGDEKAELVWESKTTVVGNNTLILNCQVSNLLK
jgi:hypothetical protein